MGYVAADDREDLDQALGRYRLFHRRPAGGVERMRCRRLMPEVLVRLGELKAVIYRSDRGRSGRPRTYIHFMEEPPVLACDPGGTQLYVLGGKYRVTSNGIDG